jgi:hypothetical protein
MLARGFAAAQYVTTRLVREKPESYYGKSH